MDSLLPPSQIMMNSRYIQLNSLGIRQHILLFQKDQSFALNGTKKEKKDFDVFIFSLFAFSLKQVGFESQKQLRLKFTIKQFYLNTTKNKDLIVFNYIYLFLPYSSFISLSDHIFQIRKIDLLSYVTNNQELRNAVLLQGRGFYYIHRGTLFDV